LVFRIQVLSCPSAHAAVFPRPWFVSAHLVVLLLYQLLASAADKLLFLTLSQRRAVMMATKLEKDFLNMQNKL